MARWALAFVLWGLLLSGCAAPARYDWNQYDQRLYDYYKSPTAEAQFVSSMEAHVRNLEAAGRKPAPGIYAELGTFYLKRGDPKIAVQYYDKEMAAWPESKGFMTALISSINKPRVGDKP